MMNLAAAAALAAACVALDPSREQITVSDLAAAHPVFAQAPAGQALGYAPAPGARRVYGAAELRRVAARFHLPLEAPAGVCFERRMASHGPERMREAMQRALPQARFEIVEHSRHPAPDGPLEFPTTGLSPPARPGGAVLWRGFARYGAGRRFAVWARVKVEAGADCVVAGAALPAGQTLTPSDLRLQRVELFPAQAGCVATLESAAGRALRRRVAAGAPLMPGWLEAPREVSPGQTVQVEAASGTARLALEARAESAGRRGQTVSVRNPSSGKRFTARVTGPGKVVVP